MEWAIFRLPARWFERIRPAADATREVLVAYIHCDANICRKSWKWRSVSSARRRDWAESLSNH